MKELAHLTQKLFQEKFNDVPDACAIAPGRLELLGNHTDYNQGVVMGLAIDRFVCIAGKKKAGTEISIYSCEFNQTETFDLKNIAKNPEAKWANYPKGVIEQFQKNGYTLSGFDLAIKSTIPLGSGVSSSAALLVATALALQKLFSGKLQKLEIAMMCHKAEHDFVGANNGILDQYCSVFGKAGHALYIDCRSLEHETVPILSSDLKIAVCQTNVKHSIVEGEYQSRRKQCEQAAEFFKKKKPGVSALRDVTSDDLKKWGKEMDPLVLKRARHIVEENERVLAGKELLKKGDLDGFGKLLFASHESSRNNFENSCSELDVMVNIAKSIKGVWGSRLSGGGFGGCTLAFVKSDRAEKLAQAVLEQYPAQTGKETDIFLCNVADGASIIY
jgi:galactokinase